MPLFAEGLKTRFPFRFRTQKVLLSAVQHQILWQQVHDQRTNIDRSSTETHKWQIATRIQSFDLLNQPNEQKIRTSAESPAGTAMAVSGPRGSFRTKRIQSMLQFQQILEILQTLKIHFILRISIRRHIRIITNYRMHFTLPEKKF